ncbi:Bax inhibitor-1/YccA family protein [Nanchangia anserum]|uniref:Bax inhibitor-1/YccA family protein n=1 Tax=Nanchangia anserum TaxID=2692125 RepID=A0A8I0GED6_9ACTO|nr:Bax inhibitor-1/YccA family protein [Nanchangia anserum]MBD3689973.1 Bax inhibitor-1/YccA family protein [Nanchangia anserum]QOX82221.1 Bax inhibitor-1/YccA family protein [Nanchangia anserum]
MANPVMTTLETQSRSRTPAGYPTMPGYTPGRGPVPDLHTGSDDFSHFEQVYASRPADNVDRGRVSIDDIIMRTGGLFLALVAAAALAWHTAAVAPRLSLTLLMGGLVIGLVLGIVNSVKKRPSPALIVAYAVAEGVLLGALSAFIDLVYPGIAIQAVVATLCVFAVTLVAYKMRIVRSSPKLRRMLSIGLIGLMVYYGASALLQLTGLTGSPLGTQTIMGFPLGLVVGLIALVLAVMSLISDFDVAERCVQAGMPREVAWTCAFGLIVTLVWLYTELLRLLQYLRIMSN